MLLSPAQNINQGREDWLNTPGPTYFDFRGLGNIYIRCVWLMVKLSGVHAGIDDKVNSNLIIFYARDLHLDIRLTNTLKCLGIEDLFQMYLNEA